MGPESSPIEEIFLYWTWYTEHYVGCREGGEQGCSPHWVSSCSQGTLCSCYRTGRWSPSLYLAIYLWLTVPLCLSVSLSLYLILALCFYLCLCIVSLIVVSHWLSLCICFSLAVFLSFSVCFFFSLPLFFSLSLSVRLSLYLAHSLSLNILHSLSPFLLKLDITSVERSGSDLFWIWIQLWNSLGIRVRLWI